MSILEELANEVKNQRDLLANNLSGLGVEASTSETLNTLVTKVTLIRDGVIPLIVVSVDTGATVTASTDGITLTEESVNGTVTFKVSKFGTWTVKATKGGQNSNTETILVERDIKRETLSFFSSTITVNVEEGSQVIVSKDGYSQTLESIGGTATFKVPSSGEYTVKATLDGIPSETKTVTISSNGETQTVSLNYITLTVTCPAGCTVNVIKDSYTYTGTASAGSLSFKLPETGEWTVSISLNSQSNQGTVNVTSYTNYSIELAFYKYYGVRINKSNSNPETAVEYIDDAVGIGSGWDNWKDKTIFKDIKPCVLKDGVVQYYLQKDNYTLKENGEASRIGLNQDGDVMVEIPKIGYKMNNDSTYNYIWITDDPNAEGYCYLAHSLDSENDCDKIYIGAYLGVYSLTGETAGKLVSVSALTPTANISLTNFRSYAQKNGAGYQLLSFYPLTLLQCFYTIIYKNLNSQAALGQGYTSASSLISTGTTNTNTFCYGNPSSGTTRVKFLGIEDMWGNLAQWIDGIYSDDSYNICTDYNNFNSILSGYRYKQGGFTDIIGTPFSSISSTNNGGFVSTGGFGSNTTYYTDVSGFSKSCSMYIGGFWQLAQAAGIFCHYISIAASSSNSTIGARLVYKHKQQ